MIQPANQTNLLFDLPALQKFLYFIFLLSHVISEVLVIFQLLVDQTVQVLGFLLYFICLVL